MIVTFLPDLICNTNRETGKDDGGGTGFYTVRKGPINLIGCVTWRKTVRTTVVR